MEAKLFGLTTTDLRKIAYQLAERFNLQNNFNEQKKIAGWDWYYKFMERHPGLSLRTAEATSAARAEGFNKEAVNEFYDILSSAMTKYNFQPTNIWNVDETGITVVPKSCGKVIGMKGRKQVGRRTSAERGKTVTAEICVSANGNYMPPLLIFPRVNYNQDYLEGSPPGAWAEFDISGWMTTEIFMRWFKKFIQYSGASKQNPVLLLLDGHNTHIKNLDLIDLAEANGVTIICIPPHTSDKLQPLDISFNKPLSTYLTDEINNCMQFENNGKPVVMRQLFKVFGRAFQKAATVQTACNGFKKPGIYPFNRNVFKDTDFAASEDSNSLISNSKKSDSEKSNPSNQKTDTVATAYSNTQSSSDPPAILESISEADPLPIEQSISDESNINNCSTQAG